MAKDTVPEHTGRKLVAVSSKKEASAAADKLASDAAAIKPKPVAPVEKHAIKKPIISKALAGLKAKRK